MWTWGSGGSGDAIAHARCGITSCTGSPVSYPADPTAPSWQLPPAAALRCTHASCSGVQVSTKPVSSFSAMPK